MTRTDLLQAGRQPSPRCRTQDGYPRRVGPWELIGLAGEGAVSQVFRARPSESAEGPAGYALKMLRPRWQDEPEAVAMLRREAVVGRSVSHANLVPILQFHLAEPPRYLVMPWLDGTTLAAALTGGVRLAVPFALGIVRQVAEALEALHTRGWRHGDVKPQNILVSPEGHATLLDLGFARSTWQRDAVADRCVRGTWHYLAPEATSPTLRADIRADLYSLGVVLFELLSGQLPFTCDDMAELARLHREARPPKLAELAPGVPEEVAELVQGMIAKSPLRRPRTPRELVDALVRLEIASFAEGRPKNNLGTVPIFACENRTVPLGKPVSYFSAASEWNAGPPGSRLLQPMLD